MSEACRAFAIECLTRQINRVLVDATGCEPEGHYALRDALTTMLLAGIPSRFGLALVTEAPRVRALFRDLQRDLRALHVSAMVFEREDEALDWLLQAPAAPQATETTAREALQA